MPPTKIRSCRLPPAQDERVAALIAQGFNFGLIVSELLGLTGDRLETSLQRRRARAESLRRDSIILAQQAKAERRGFRK